MHRLRPISLGVWLALLALSACQVGMMFGPAQPLKADFAAKQPTDEAPVLAASPVELASVYTRTARDARGVGIEHLHLLCERSAVAAPLVEVRTPLALSLAIAPHGGALPMPHLRI